MIIGGLRCSTVFGILQALYPIEIHSLFSERVNKPSDVIMSKIEIEAQYPAQKRKINKINNCKIPVKTE